MSVNLDSLRCVAFTVGSGQACALHPSTNWPKCDMIWIFEKSGLLHETQRQQLGHHIAQRICWNRGMQQIYRRHDGALRQSTHYTYASRELGGSRFSLFVSYVGVVD